MRIDLLGLDLETAHKVLESEGICPEVVLTSAPKRTDETRGILRVVYASDDGRMLTVARFLDPLFESDRKSSADGE